MIEPSGEIFQLNARYYFTRMLGASDFERIIVHNSKTPYSYKLKNGQTAYGT